MDSNDNNGDTAAADDEGDDDSGDNDENESSLSPPPLFLPAQTPKDAGDGHPGQDPPPLGGHRPVAQLLVGPGHESRLHGNGLRRHGPRSRGVPRGPPGGSRGLSAPQDPEGVTRG